MLFVEQNLNEFAASLASKSPTPGGGGASALAGAVGIALGEMVGALTVGKPKYAEVEDEIKDLLERAGKLRARLLDCVDRDAAAFAPLGEAYKLPKDAPGRGETMERCLRDAAAVPLEIFDLCCEAIELLRAFGEKGSALAVSDAATGAVLCRGAMYGAAVNVKANTKLMKDREYAETVNRHVDGMMEKYWRIAEKTYEDIYGSMG